MSRKPIETREELITDLQKWGNLSRYYSNDNDGWGCHWLLINEQIEFILDNFERVPELKDTGAYEAIVRLHKATVEMQDAMVEARDAIKASFPKQKGAK